MDGVGVGAGIEIEESLADLGGCFGVGVLSGNGVGGS